MFQRNLFLSMRNRELRYLLRPDHELSIALSLLDGTLPT